MSLKSYFPQHAATPDRFQALSPLPAITEGAFMTVCQRQTPLNQMWNYNKNACCIMPKAEHTSQMKLIKHVSAQSPPVFFQ